MSFAQRIHFNSSFLVPNLSHSFFFLHHDSNFFKGGFLSESPNTAAPQGNESLFPGGGVPPPWNSPSPPCGAECG